jgi:hypothetical protein
LSQEKIIDTRRQNLASIFFVAILLLQRHHGDVVKQPDMAFCFMPVVNHLPVANGGCSPVAPHKDI